MAEERVTQVVMQVADKPDTQQARITQQVMQVADVSDIQQAQVTQVVIQVAIYRPKTNPRGRGYVIT
jgi:hypothetical protein